MAALKRMGVTSVMTAERTEDYGDIGRYGVEEFVSDNVVILRNVLEGERRRRTVEILKLRGTAAFSASSVLPWRTAANCSKAGATAAPRSSGANGTIPRIRESSRATDVTQSHSARNCAGTQSHCTNTIFPTATGPHAAR